MNTLQWDFNRNSNNFSPENAFENVICDMAPLLSASLCQFIGFAITPWTLEPICPLLPVFITQFTVSFTHRWVTIRRRFRNQVGTNLFPTTHSTYLCSLLDICNLSSCVALCLAWHWLQSLGRLYPFSFQKCFLVIRFTSVYNMKNEKYTKKSSKQNLPGCKCLWCCNHHRE